MRNPFHIWKPGVDTNTAMPDSTQVPRGAGRNPSGWEILVKNDSVVDMINALLSMPPHREFNKSEFSDFAGVSRKSVHTHLDLLLHLGLVEKVPDTTPTRYRFNPDSEIAELLIKLDGAVNNAGPYTEE